MLTTAASWLMLTTGAVFVFIGGIGVLRMPDLYTRIHASGLTDSLGPILVLAGLMLQAGTLQEIFKLAAILLFMMITGPTATYALANAVLMSGTGPGSRGAAAPEDDA